MYLYGFFLSATPMLVILVGLTLFTVRREHCNTHYAICILITVALQLAVYFFMFYDAAGIQGFSISKILTTLMICFLIFWGGRFVYGGWSRIGIYLFATDIILGIGERIYWATWELITHRTAEQSVIYFYGDTEVVLSSLSMVLTDCILLIPVLIIGYKLRARSLRPEWLIKTVIIVYLILGSSSLTARTGFDEVPGVHTALVAFVWLVLYFSVIMTAHISVVHENQRIFYMKKQVAAEQTRLLVAQNEKVRRLRHDVKKHLSNLEYILEKEPELLSDPAVLAYRKKLNESEGWLTEGFYCESTALNLCFEQIRRYCDSRSISAEIGLKRLHCSGWKDENTD